MPIVAITSLDKAESAGVIVYAFSTHENCIQDHDIIGNEALKVLAERTGGALFAPGSLGFLNHSLDQLQEVIRSRYRISYKPSEFKRDDKYHTISIKVQKSGSRRRVYARKGYVAHEEGSRELETKNRGSRSPFNPTSSRTLSLT